MAVHLLSNVRAVLADRVLDGATVASEDGRILEIEENRSYVGAIDGRGAFCLPGLVDSHCDAIEREVSPRPTVSFDLGFALRSLEAKFLAAGITTACHGVSFEGKEERVERMRSPEMAEALVGVIAARRAAGARIDHRVLFRLPARTTDSVDRAIACLPGGQPADDLPLVSFEDHTPGQGQYRSVDMYKAAIPEAHLARIGDVDAEIARRIAEGQATLPVREANLARVRELAAAKRARVLAHDCVDPEEVAEAQRWGAAVTEFPVTLAAARAARDRGMPTVLGAPNVLLGGSHSGNASAEELIAAGCCTGLASDYAANPAGRGVRPGGPQGGGLPGRGPADHRGPGRGHRPHRPGPARAGLHGRPGPGRAGRPLATGRPRACLIGGGPRRLGGSHLGAAHPASAAPSRRGDALTHRRLPPAEGPGDQLTQPARLRTSAPPRTPPQARQG